MQAVTELATLLGPQRERGITWDLSVSCATAGLGLRSLRSIPLPWGLTPSSLFWTWGPAAWEGRDRLQGGSRSACGGPSPPSRACAGLASGSVMALGVPLNVAEDPSNDSPESRASAGRVSPRRDPESCCCFNSWC